MSESIMQKERRCYLCGAETGLDRHHVMNGPNRRRAEKDGLWIYLCRSCHDRTHFDPDWSGKNMLLLKCEAQKSWQEHYRKTTGEWIKAYGKSYLLGPDSGPVGD